MMRETRGPLSVRECVPVRMCVCVRTETIYVKTKFEYNTQGDYSSSLPYITFVTEVHIYLLYHFHITLIMFLNTFYFLLFARSV